MNYEDFAMSTYQTSAGLRSRILVRCGRPNCSRSLSELSGSNPVGLIPLGNVPNEQLQAFSTELNRALNGRELIVSTDLRQTAGVLPSF